jgi:murein L,D-transpeptidase YcbB/YkuD
LRKAILIPILLLGLALLFCQTPPAQSGNTASKSTSKKTASKKKSGSKKTAGKKATWRNTQRAPTPERYKEIQQALAEKGYLQATPNGVWDASSVEALKKFQQDQSLDPSGKIDSLSLIALGLGPRREPQPAPQP